jgi:putative ABC transport system ATP-binding protein
MYIWRVTRVAASGYGSIFEPESDPHAALRASFATPCLILGKSMITPIALLAGVSKRYRLGSSDVHALQGVDLEVFPARFTVLSGPSGSGKTTLLNMVGCIDRPDSGQVTISGQALDSLAERSLTDFRAKNIGFVFQNFNLIPVLSVFENVEYPLVMINVPAEERTARVTRMLEQVGLADQGAKRPNELSGGQMQRVAIARALVKSPAIVLADEPTANLDSATGKSIIDLMHKMQLETKTSFVFSSHDPHVIAQADDTVWIRDGKIESINRATEL